MVSASARPNALGFFARWSRIWSAFGRIPVTWHDMHDTPASTARSGRFGSETIAMGPLSSRVFSALARKNPCSPLGSEKMASPPACWNGSATSPGPSGKAKMLRRSGSRLPLARSIRFAGGSSKS